MKLTLLFVILAITANAQTNTISVNTYSLNSSNQNIYRLDSLSNIQSKERQLQFTIGYYRKVKNNISANLQFGLFNSPYEAKRRANVDDDNSYFLDSIDNVSKSVFLRLGIGKITNHNKYFFITSINLPIKYTYKTEYYYRSNYYLNDNSFYNSQITSEKYPKSIETGLILSQSIGYKILNSLSVSVELNTGLNLNFVNGTRYYSKIETVANGTQTTKEQTIKYKNSYSSSIVFYPIISLNYHF